MSKMTDEQIKKALECCTKPYCNNNKCPLHQNTVNTKDCITQLSTNALDLINRQQAEIEKLNVELVGMRGACNSYKMHYDNAKAEIEVLKVDAKRVDKDLEELDRPLTEIRAEAIKEFAERLKENTVIVKIGKQNCKVITVDGIDYYKREMVGEDK